MTDKMDRNENGNSDSALRDAAEEKRGKSQDAPTKLEDLTSEKIIHELRVHQIELEIQNEELRRMQLELEASRDEFQDLYDFSPVGYFTLTQKGLITQANLTGASLLGMPRPKLISLGFAHFVDPESEDQYYQHILKVRKQEGKQYCDLTLKREDGSSFYARLESIRTDEPVAQQTETGRNHLIRTMVIDITERKRIEDDLRESEERLRTLAQNAPDAIYVQTQRRFAYLNPMALKLFGAETPDQLLGQPVIDRFEPSCHDTVKERIRVINEERRSVNMLEEICVRLDGTPFHAEVSAAPVKWGEHDGALVFFRDITKRLELEERLRHNQIMLARTERIAQIGSWEWEVATDSVTWSDELFRIFQLDPTRGAPSFEEHTGIFTPDSMARLREAVGLAISDGIPYELELQGIRSDGETRHIRVSGFPERGPDGSVNYLFGSSNDFTDRKRFEEERLEMERKLLHAQKLESLGVMAGGIAHDFNNLLQVVLGNLDIALDDIPPDSEARTSILNAIKASERSAELSGQMLVYSGSSLYLPRDIYLYDLLNKTKSLLQSSISRHVALDFDICTTLPPIKGEANQIQRLICNLVVNASEAIGDNAGAVTLRTGVTDCDEAYLSHSRLEIVPEPGRFVFLEVADTGCGMDAITQHKLFDPFFSTKFWGRGLGMAEVMGIIKGHHGAIMVDSEVGRGTTIRVLFSSTQQAPASTVHPMEAVETKPASAVDTNWRKTILVVDDEEMVRGLLIRRLEALGYDTISASDGDEGVHVFRERLNEIDLVMLDYKMPKMNGVEAFEELIRIKPEVKVILGSGYTEDVVMDSFPGQRPACVLHKPYNMADLKAELDILLGTPG
jgi:PAS domain S-box-containing protein